MQHIPENRQGSDLTFFVNAALWHRQPIFADPRAAQIAMDSLQHLRQSGEIWLYGFVIMPGHVHLLVHPLPPQTLPKIMRRFKTWVAHELNKGSIWDKGYFSKVVVDREMLRKALHYIHENPVVAGLAPDAGDYPWSSAVDYYRRDALELVDPY